MQNLEHEETLIQTFFRLSGSSRRFLDQTLSRSEHPDTFRVMWIFCIASGHLPIYPEILHPIMNRLQKLSGFAKTFRSALLTRWRVFSDSVLLFSSCLHPEWFIWGNSEMSPGWAENFWTRFKLFKNAVRRQNKFQFSPFLAQFWLFFPSPICGQF